MRFSLPSSRGAPLALATMLCAGLLGTTAPAQARPTIVVNAIVAPMPPPPLQAELVPAAPFVSAVWVPGHWFWERGRYVWLPGHYAYPRQGMHWVPAHWRPYRGGWSLVAGHWAR